MNQDEIREQPEQEQAMEDEKIDMSADGDSGSQISTKSGGVFGKFKSPEALYEAYKNLQAEFTRKCQKLSEFEKEKTGENTLSDSEIDDGLSKFLEKNTEASNYSDELKAELRSDKGDDPFENAWAKIVSKRFMAQSSQKAEDPLVKKYVFEDEELKNKVIEIYMKELNSKKPPILLSTESGQRATKPESVAPNSLSEAKKMVQELFS